jgi:hypothetical protein
VRVIVPVKPAIGVAEINVLPDWPGAVIVMELLGLAFKLKSGGLVESWIWSAVAVVKPW